LRHRDFTVQAGHHAVSVTDPDGVRVVFQQDGMTRRSSLR